MVSAAQNIVRKPKTIIPFLHHCNYFIFLVKEDLKHQSSYSYIIALMQNTHTNQSQEHVLWEIGHLFIIPSKAMYFSVFFSFKIFLLNLKLEQMLKEKQNQGAKFNQMPCHGLVSVGHFNERYSHWERPVEAVGVRCRWAFGATDPW